jgi:uncharacterized RDD family membrane protein YckC
LKKADYLHRGIAKAIDFLIVGVCFSLSWAGVLAGALYIVISDGFGGRSVGKRLIGLRVVVTDPEGGANPSLYRESILRNLGFGLIVVFSSLGPILGTLCFLLGLLYIAAETYFVYYDDLGLRIGDILGGTRVVDEARNEAKA